MKAMLLLLLAILGGCSGMERSENEKIRRRNCKGEYIYRNHDEYLFAIAPPIHTPRPHYPWEGHLTRITKDFFRCKGSSLHPPLPVQGDAEKPAFLSDCDGPTRHGLPIIHAKEGVYPILIDLLNYVQQRTNKKVAITCGHRCPAHNEYADPSKENKMSKHQIGAEVDFYVQGMEEDPLAIAELLMDYYRQTPPYRGQKEYEAFQRYEKSELTHKPWLNKEICIKVQLPSEGRDGDNRHPYPYLTIQVRYDRDSKERVLYDWKRANLGYPRG